MASKLARMHTAEHLLSAVMRKQYQAPRNVEFHLGEKKTKCDYEVPSPITSEDIDRIESLVNAQIAQDHPVSDFLLNREQAREYDLWKVPGESDKIRIVQIGEFDAQPCRGDHVSHTTEIGAFLISSYDIKNDGRLRIRFKVE